MLDEVFDESVANSYSLGRELAELSKQFPNKCAVVINNQIKVILSPEDLWLVEEAPSNTNTFGYETKFRVITLRPLKNENTIPLPRKTLEPVETTSRRTLPRFISAILIKWFGSNF